jgi:hypothetical protein
MALPYKTLFLTAEQLANGNNFACVKCSERWLESEIKYQDGVESDFRCPNCYEDNGGELARDADRAAASELAALISEQHEIPPKHPGWADEFSEVCTILTFSPEPRTLTKGGASAVLTITGRNLATTDTITYGHAGITNASAASLTPVTFDSNGNTVAPHWDVLVLTVQASGAVTNGLHTLTYNDVLYRNVFDVRG